MTANLDKLLITHRRVEFYVVRERYGFGRFCRECRTERQFVSVEDAMDTSNLTMRQVVRMVEAGDIHFAESERGLLMLCQHSLPPSTSSAQPESIAALSDSLLEGEK